MSNWVEPEVRKLAAPDEFGRVFPFAVHIYYPDTCREMTWRNLLLPDAERMADEERERRPDARIHVSVDACG